MRLVLLLIVLWIGLIDAFRWIPLHSFLVSKYQVSEGATSARHVGIKARGRRRALPSIFSSYSSARFGATATSSSPSSVIQIEGKKEGQDGEAKKQQQQQSQKGKKREGGEEGQQAEMMLKTPSIRIQTLDYTTLVRLTTELRDRLLPGRVENVVQTDDFSLMLQIRSMNDLCWLLLCWQPEAARVSLVTDGPRAGGPGGGGKKKGGGGMAAGGLYSLPGQMKVFLQLKTLIGMTMPLPGERILVFEFADRVTDERSTHKLYIEIMGRRSNLMLVDSQEEEKVLACGYQVSPSKSIRSVSVGQPYVLPPPLKTPLPALPLTPEAQAIEEAEFTRRVSLLPTYPLGKAMIATYRGLSPQLIDGMAQACGLVGSTEIVGEIGEEGLAKLYRGPFLQWVRVLKAEEAKEKTRRITSTFQDAPSIKKEKKILPAAAAADFDEHQAPSLQAASPPCGLSRDGLRYTPTFFEQQQHEKKKEEKEGVKRDGKENQWIEMTSVLDLVERYYTTCVQHQELLDLQRKGLSRVQAVKNRLDRTRNEFASQLTSASEEEVAKLQEVANLQMKADLLTAFAYSWKQGDEECICYDFDTGEEVRVPLKPGKSAADEAQDAYQRIRKLKRSIDAVEPLLRKVEVKLAYVEELESTILQLGIGTASIAQDLIVMREIAEELGMEVNGGTGGGTVTFFSNILNRLSDPADTATEGEGGNRVKKAISGRGKGGKKQGKGKQGKGGGKQAQQQQDNKKGGGPSVSVQSYRPRPSSSSDRPPISVHVGRNSKQNDYVSFSLAQPHELWFHAQGVPGAHCLLRFDPGTEVGDEDMQFAADLAAYFSKARGAAQVPVMWTSPKNLKRIVGGGPGMVQVTKEKVMWGRPEVGGRIVREKEEEKEDARG